MKHISVSSVTQRLPENCRSFSHLKYLAQSLCRPSDEEYGTVKSDYLALVTAKCIADYYHMSTEFLEEQGHTYTVSEEFSTRTLDKSTTTKFVQSLSHIKARDYQIDAIHNILESDRGLILSSYWLRKVIHYLCSGKILRSESISRVLIVVPTTSLVEQMFTDFADYGWASDEFCHRLYAR